jgi:elongation factor P--(R)-beta-lysine ligase
VSSAPTWQPAANVAGLQRRAAALAQTRQFFAQRDVLEVETPILARYSVTEPHIQSIRATVNSSEYWLRTSPEYHMKRLLAAGCPDIYQIGKSFRGGETGTRHQPEFTMIEWYRHDITIKQLEKECCELITELGRDRKISICENRHVSYCELFQKFCSIDPLTATVSELRQAAQNLLKETVNAKLAADLGDDRLAWLDLLASHVIYPTFPANVLIVVADYPHDQAMLARLQPGNRLLADRFEIFLNGIELANGFHELRDATEQAIRFEEDRRRRSKLGLPDMLPDTELLTALTVGLPDCCGVAVGLDRVLMAVDGHPHIKATMSFLPGQG